MTKKKTETNKATQTFIIGDTPYKTNFTNKFEKRKKWEMPDESLIISFIPGTINKIFVQIGDIVKEGDKLLILEAMKMKNLIKVPYDGEITKINIEEGQKIPKGYCMVEMELQGNLKKIEEEMDQLTLDNDIIE